MRTVTAATIWVCVDCRLAHAGYCAEELGFSESDPRWLAVWSLELGDVSDGLVPGEHAPDCPVFLTGDWQHECECALDSFSLSPCDGCGCSLAGERYGFTVWVPVTTVGGVR